MVITMKFMVMMTMAQIHVVFQFAIKVNVWPSKGTGVQSHRDLNGNAISFNRRNALIAKDIFSSLIGIVQSSKIAILAFGIHFYMAHN